MKRSIIGIFLFAVISLVMPSQAFAQYNGVVTVDSVAGKAGDIVAVNVYLKNNNLDFSGLKIPLQYDKSILSVDTILFDNSILDSTFSAQVNYDSFNGTINIFYLANFELPLPFYSMSDGILATIMFKISDVAPLIDVEIDSINVFDLSWSRIEISDNTGFFAFYPDFVPGQVKVVLTTGIEDDIKSGLPLTFALDQNYPNPFNPSTTIDYAVSKAGHVNLQVFNILGQEVVSLVNEHQSSGIYKVQFNGRNHPSGIYFYRLSSEEGSYTRKMVMIK